MKKLVMGMMVVASLVAAPAFAADDGAIPSDSDQTMIKVGYGLVASGVITAIILTTRQDNGSTSTSSASASTTQ